MANTTTSPYMGMPVPVVSIDPGPDWATNVDASLSIIDSHNHTTGQGNPVPSAGININADLPFNGNNAISLRSTRYNSQSAALSGASDLDCLYVVGADLYYNDGAGNQVRITQSGSVTGASGTITGLPSGTASASYSGGVFTFRSATNTPATMNIGPIVTGAQVASPNTVTISAQATQPANYAIQWPLAQPAANQTIVFDSSGNMSGSFGLMPIGSVIATFPNLTGAYSTVATTAADTYGFVLCQGQTISDATSPMNGQIVPNINNTIFILGSTTAGTSGGTSNLQHGHIMSHVHQWAYQHEVSSGVSSFYGLTSDNISAQQITTSDVKISNGAGGNSGTGSLYNIASPNTEIALWTTGVVDPPLGTPGHDAETATSLNSPILPPYISAVYLMRIK